VVQSSSPVTSYTSDSVAAAPVGRKIDYGKVGGYNPASRGAAPVTSYSPAASVAAAPSGGKIEYKMGSGYNPKPLNPQP
jgi:hypothetical protein